MLENIVGRDFLPRGTGIVTRRPLVLRLINRGGRRKSLKNQSVPSTPHSTAPSEADSDENSHQVADFENTDNGDKSSSGKLLSKHYFPHNVSKWPTFPP